MIRYLYAYFQHGNRKPLCLMDWKKASISGEMSIAVLCPRPKEEAEIDLQGLWIPCFSMLLVLIHMLWIYVHMYVYGCLYAYIYIRIYVFYSCVFNLSIYFCIYMSIFIYIYIYVHIHTCLSVCLSI